MARPIGRGGVIGTAKYLFGLSVGLIALLCFAAAAVIDRRPDVPRAPPPDAQEVRAALGFGQMALILMGTSSPVSFTLPQAWLDGVHSSSEEHTSELPSLMSNTYAVFCL